MLTSSHQQREMKKMLKEATMDRKKGVEERRKERRGDERGITPWFTERECLLLLLKARKLLREMIEVRVKEDRIAAGELSIGEIQKLLEGQEEENELDFISEIQELKAQMVNDIRRNHALEADLKKLDKRIALLIKNRGNLQMVLAAQQGLKSQKKKKQVTAGENETIISDPKRLEHYQNLFYLLQTEPRYLARLVFLMKSKDMENFLDTVLLTLYGDAFSPREEFLILELFKHALNFEMKGVKDVRDFLKADSVVPQMVSTYNRRKQGLQYLQQVLGKVLNNVIADAEFDLELKPLTVYNKIIADHMVQTGEQWTEEKLTDEAAIYERKDVQTIIKARVKRLIAIADVFFSEITGSLAHLPYGIRWICRLLHDLAEENFPDAKQDDIMKIVSYFVYYRFFNLAIITPDEYDIIDRDLPPVARKNLVAVAKTLQNLFNLILFDAKKQSWMAPVNTWIKGKMDEVREYFEELIDVETPDDELQLDKYMELTQKTKPLIVISLHEIAETHRHIAEHLPKLAADANDPLRIIVKDLGDAPVAAVGDDDREVQLVLTNRFAEKMEAEISAGTSLYVETKELVISALRVIPITDGDDINLVNILRAGKKHAKLKNNTALEAQIKKILDNLKSLEGEGCVTKDDNYSAFLREIALEVANRAAVREQQKKEIKRLTVTRQNLRAHQDYLNTQIEQYQNYLQDCRKKQQAGNQKKAKKVVKDGQVVEESKTVGPFKFTHSKLTDKGILVESDVPSLVRKKTVFEISSETPGEFKVVCKIANKEVALRGARARLDSRAAREWSDAHRARERRARRPAHAQSHQQVLFAQVKSVLSSLLLCELALVSASFE
jgi:Ras GTPase-activating-like protein IQGAP2/3